MSHDWGAVGARTASRSVSSSVVGSDILRDRTSLRPAICIAVCALKDSEQKVFPRWPGYYNIFEGMSLFATAAILFFKTSSAGVERCYRLLPPGCCLLLLILHPVQHQQVRDRAAGGCAARQRYRRFRVGGRWFVSECDWHDRAPGPSAKRRPGGQNLVTGAGAVADFNGTGQGGFVRRIYPNPAANAQRSLRCRAICAIPRGGDRDAA